MSQNRWIVFGAIYAENLGDGVIAECLRHGLKIADPGCEVIFLDISARDAFGDTKLPNKSNILKFLQILPSLGKQCVSVAGLSVFLMRNALPKWRKVFLPNDILIIGGGHLLSDYNLNFPLKIFLIDWIARRSHVKSTIYAVGVSKLWSPIARKLFTNIANRAVKVGIAVRDEESSAFLSLHMPHLASRVQIARDPGLLARDVYMHSPCRGKGIGINISDPVELSQYTSKKKSKDIFIDTWKIIIETLISEGKSVTLFTNGAKEDHAYLERLVAELGSTSSHENIYILDRPLLPSEMVSQIKGLDILVGHRLHAHIVAFAHEIPGIGLEWDVKLRSFFRIANIEHNMISTSEISADTIINKIATALNTPLSGKSVSALREETQNDIVNLAKKVLLPAMRASDLN